GRIGQAVFATPYTSHVTRAARAPAPRRTSHFHTSRTLSGVPCKRSIGHTAEIKEGRASMRAFAAGGRPRATTSLERGWEKGMGVILVAFERESEQSAIEQLLASRGHQVQKAGTGPAALDAARRAPPDAIVSDIVLPRMDGFALCRKWKQDEKLQSVPFIFYTRRHDDPKYERFALELGAERFLARSVAPEALAAAIDELLAKAG